jgi:hypothetical protein
MKGSGWDRRDSVVRGRCLLHRSLSPRAGVVGARGDPTEAHAPVSGRLFQICDATNGLRRTRGLRFPPSRQPRFASLTDGAMEREEEEQPMMSCTAKRLPNLRS